MIDADACTNHSAKAYSRVFKFSMCLMLLDFVLCTIWLPVSALANDSFGF